MVTKTYDEIYNLTKVHDAENKDYLYQYDDAGRVTKLTYPNGWVEDYTYDNEGNLLKTVDTDPFHNNKKSTKFEYRYDAEGNLISEYKRDTTAGNKALTTTYAYDALNRLVSAHEEGVGLNTTRTYDYDTLGNLIRQEEDGCIEYKYNGYALDETTKCGTIPNSIGTSYWEYTYDKRGNLISNDKYTRTTSGMAWQNEESFVYDETGRMVQGKNEQGELSLYTYNGLGIRVGRELVMKDNTHGYTDFHSQTPSVSTDIDKPEVVKESYVIDYTSATFNTLVMDEVGGFNYRWVYGLERLSVKITSEGTNWWGQNVTTDILKDYLHQDRLGSTTNLSDQFGRVVGRADYNEWGEITYRESLSISSSYRRIYPQLNYTGYDWDDVLGMYYAKARFYSADDKRFVAMDPIKGSVVDPLSLVSYLYCVDNPLRWVDPLGLELTQYEFGNGYGYESIELETKTINGEKYASLDDLLDLYGFAMDVVPDTSSVFEKKLQTQQGPISVLKEFHGRNNPFFKTGRTSNPSVDRQEIEIEINNLRRELTLKNKALGDTAKLKFIRDNETGKYFAKVSCFSDAMEKANYAKTLKISLPRFFDIVDFGKLSEKFESNGKPGTISSGKGDTGGKSYGAYQFASNLGVPQMYMNWLNNNNYKSLYNELSTAFKKDGEMYGENFDNAWENLANTQYEQFFLTQHMFTQEQYYQKTIDKVEAETGIDLRYRGYALQNVIWSRSVQHGADGGKNVIIRAMSTLDMDTATSEDLIKAIYAESGALDTSSTGTTMHGSLAKKYGIEGDKLKYFGRNSSDVQIGVWIRLHISELNDALAMYKQFG